MKTNCFVHFIMMAIIAFGVSVSLSSCIDDDDKIEDLTISQSSIIGHWAGDSEDCREILYILENNRIGYAYDNLKDHKDWIYIDAGGTYTIDGNVINAKYEQVEVGGFSGYSTKSVMGFTNNTPKTIKYTIIDCTDDCMTIKNGATGTTTKFYKY